MSPPQRTIPGGCPTDMQQTSVITYGIDGVLAERLRELAQAAGVWRHCPTAEVDLAMKAKALANCEVAEERPQPPWHHGSLPGQVHQSWNVVRAGCPSRAGRLRLLSALDRRCG